jgi:hypothetical protein
MKMFESAGVTEGLIVFSATSNKFQKLSSTPAKSHRQAPSKKGIKKFRPNIGLIFMVR